MTRVKRPLRHCVYCGQACFAITCEDHDDLLKLDPVYAKAKA